MNAMYSNNPFYPNGAFQQGMVPNNQPMPKTGNWLPADKFAMLQKNINQFKLSVTEEEVARGQCNHYNQNGTPALIADPDGCGYTCAICGTHFNSYDFTQEEVDAATAKVLDILNTIKIMYLSIDPNAAVEYFQIIPFIEKIPQIYKIAVDDFKKYEGINSFNPSQQQNPFNIFSMMTNPMAFQQPMNTAGYYQAPQVAPQQMMGQQPMMNGYSQQNPGFGYNPLYGAPVQQGYQPQPNGYTFNPQGAAQPGMVNTNMPVQPQAGTPAPQATPTGTEEVKVDTNFKK